jgi:Dullard-like phosphatase family protein
MATHAWTARSLLPRSGRRSLSTGGTSRAVASLRGPSIAFHVRDLPTTTTTTSYWDRATDSASDRLRVVLDLDECLVHCRVFHSHLDAALYSHQHRNGGAFFRTYMAGGAYGHVWLRPGVLDFLRSCTAAYDTYIFTASLPAYANPILDQLDAAVRQTEPPTSIFRGRFYRHHCTLDPLQNQYVKDLSTLPKQLSNHLHRTVLVDNNPSSFKQPENGILVPSFFNEAARDGPPPFPRLLQQFQELSQLPDVRSILNAAATQSLLPEPPCQMAVAM